jgi:hypothetical protein
MAPLIYAWTRYYFYDPPARRDGPRFSGTPACPDVYNPPEGALSRPDLLSVSILDLQDRLAADTAFAQLAQQIQEAEQEAAPRCEAVMYSVLAFGVEPGELRAEETHAAYNRMWANHPELWEVIQGRGLPICLWLVDALGRPFHGIVQPALGGDFEIWGSRDARTTQRYEAYRAEGRAWGAMLLPLDADVIGPAQAHIQSARAANRPRD